ncbi:kinase-like protein [Phanerochaete sordida]|uniref:Kinase-like protein n=1 Tax=Phanerochaete sordida TaxID=48140 RepID=A0A9P3G324_9APHY|nr:kinase-like protein [Phanerochaete sordida]
MTSPNAPHDREQQLVRYCPDVVSKRLQLALVKFVVSLPAVDDELRLSLEWYISKMEKRPMKVFESPRTTHRPLHVFSPPPRSKPKALAPYSPAKPVFTSQTPLKSPVAEVARATTSTSECPKIDFPKSTVKQGQDPTKTYERPVASHSTTDAPLPIRFTPRQHTPPPPVEHSPHDTPPTYLSRDPHPAQAPPVEDPATPPHDALVVSRDGTDYILTGMIGSGGSGRVFSVQTQHGESFALKVVHKPIAYRCPDGRNMALVEQRSWERATLSRRAFLMPLLKSWDDEENIYFLMPLYRENLVHRLSDMDMSREQHDLKLYAAESIAAVANLHALGVIHRDLKPHNFLLSPNGHLVLADFGLAWMAPNGSSNVTNVGLTFRTGTRAYFAPEVVVAETVGYDYRADIWSLGLMLLELYLGERQPLYYGDSREKMIANMVTRDLPVDEVQDSEFKDLLSKMLVRDVDRRWSAAKLKKHPYFEGIDWKMLEKGYYRADYRPPSSVPSKSPMAFHFNLFHCGSDVWDVLSVHLGPDGKVLPRPPVTEQLALDTAGQHTAFAFDCPIQTPSPYLYDAAPRPCPFKLRLDPPPAYTEDDDDLDDTIQPVYVVSNDDDTFSDED